jgi:hypothetical protein
MKMENWHLHAANLNEQALFSQYRFRLLVIGLHGTKSYPSLPDQYAMYDNDHHTAHINETINEILQMLLYLSAYKHKRGFRQPH